MFSSRFYNTKNKDTTLDDSKSWTRIMKLGNFTFSPVSRFPSLPSLSCLTPSLENAHTFCGSENRLTETRTYDVNFICIYDLTW